MQEPQDRRFARVHSGGNLTVENIMFRDGNSDLISTLSGGGVGGALYVEIGSHVTLDNVIFFGNRSDTA